MIKVLSIFGTRPEAIKMAPVIKELEKHPNQILSRTCVTAQHRQMLDQVLAIFQIKPDYDLNIMQQSQSPTQVAAHVLVKLEEILRAEKPDWVLVQGDTTTVLAAAVAAYYARVKVGHIEAGLRTYDKWQPFPEEINRKVAGVIADMHFAPTTRSRQNLLSEGISDRHIHVTGNTVIDALQMAVKLDYDLDSGPLHTIPFDKRILLVTSHRRENFGVPFENICYALCTLANRYSEDIHIVYPVHLNPNVREPAFRILGNIPNISLIEPLEYLPLINLMKRATLVLTDSGGIQEEAPSLGKPVLVFREVTERPEAVDAGTVLLVGTQQEKIVDSVNLLLTNEAAYASMSRAINPYGDGRASERIVQAIMTFQE